MEEYISPEQWNQLSEEQKKAFQEEIDLMFEKEELPSFDNVRIFLGRNNLLASPKMLSEFEVPPALENIETLWRKVIIFFNKSIIICPNPECKSDQYEINGMSQQTNKEKQESQSSSLPMYKCMECGHTYR